jgi:hypothetical protein
MQVAAGIGVVWLFGLVVWLGVGVFVLTLMWRAVKALERIASAVEQADALKRTNG